MPWSHHKKREGKGSYANAEIDKTTDNQNVEEDEFLFHLSLLLTSLYDEPDSRGSEELWYVSRMLTLNLRFFLPRKLQLFLKVLSTQLICFFG